MQFWAFWKNPLVVSALRVRYRQRTPGLLAATYVLGLVTLGGIVYRYLPSDQPWARIYLTAVFGIQAVLGAVASWSQNLASLRNEVAHRTLDFQRLCSLTPQEIVLGKLVGEAAPALAMWANTLPLTLLCTLWGGTDLAGWLVVNVGLVTLCLLSGAIGQLQPLELPDGAPSGQRPTPAWGLALLSMMFVPQVIGVTSQSSPTQPWGAAIGLILPVFSLRGMYEGQVWKPAFHWYALDLPFVVLNPIVQCALAALAIGMVRRSLTFPVQPRLDKRAALALCVVVDVLAAGFLYDSGPLARALPMRAGLFVACHLAIATVAVLLATPSQAALDSWVWRFRGQLGPLRDAWQGARHENLLLGWLVGIVGAANLALLVWLPAWFERPALARGALGDCGTLAVVVLVACAGWSALAQMTAIVAVKRESIWGGLFLLALLLVAVPHAVGEYWTLPGVSATSLSWYLVHAVQQGTVYNPWPLLSLSAVLYLGSRWLVRRWIDNRVRQVASHLASMCVTAADHAA